MATLDIVTKLNNLIRDTEEWTELEVMYLFVQTRKLLDHQRSNNVPGYDHLRFYSDWIVHISKDRIDTNTLEILRDFETGMKEMIGNRDYNAAGPINFAYFESLQPEIVEFYKTQDINHKPFLDDDVWVDVISSVVKALENQPLNIKASYGLLIKSIEFLPSAPQTVWLRAYFNEKFKGADGIEYGHFDLKNVY